MKKASDKLKSYKKRMNLEGKTVLVVGAGRGIGRRTAEIFAEADAKARASEKNK